MLCLHAVSDEDGHPMENEDQSGRRLCDFWSTIFQARAEGSKHHQFENILQYVQKAPDDIRWVIDRTEFDELIARKKDSAPGPDRIPYSAYRCAGGLGFKFLLKACRVVLEGSAIPDCFAESRTVFISKTSDTDDNGRIIGSSGALRPLTLCNCDCKLLTTATCRGLHWYTMRCIHPLQRCISSKHMTDNIFDIETTALAHVACAPQESGVLLTDFAAAYPSVNHSWILSVLEKTELPEFICRFLPSIKNDSTRHVEFVGTTRKKFLMNRCVRQGCPASGFSFCNGLRLYLQMAPRDTYNLDFLAACPMCLC